MVSTRPSLHGKDCTLVAWQLSHGGPCVGMDDVSDRASSSPNLTKRRLVAVARDERATVAVLAV